MAKGFSNAPPRAVVTKPSALRKLVVWVQGWLSNAEAPVVDETLAINKLWNDRMRIERQPTGGKQQGVMWKVYVDIDGRFLKVGQTTEFSEAVDMAKKQGQLSGIY